MLREKISEDRLKELIEIARKLTPQEAGYVLRFSYGVEEKVCPECGKLFIGHLRQKHCSSYCSMKAYKKRRYRDRKKIHQYDGREANQQERKEGDER